MIFPSDWYTVEPVKLETHPEPVNCQEVLEEVAMSLRPLAQAKHLGFEVIVPVTPVKIHTDRSTLSQILSHLVKNAIEATQRGSVCIELRRRMDGGSSKVFTEFSVEDTGRGMQPEELVRLFKDSKNPGNSAAQSLFQSQLLADSLGGRLEWMSIFGQGSIFRLVLPQT